MNSYQLLNNTIRTVPEGAVDVFSLTLSPFPEIDVDCSKDGSLDVSNFLNKYWNPG